MFVRFCMSSQLRTQKREATHKAVGKVRNAAKAIAAMKSPRKANVLADASTQNIDSLASDGKLSKQAQRRLISATMPAALPRPSDENVQPKVPLMPQLGRSTLSGMASPPPPSKIKRRATHSAIDTNVRQTSVREAAKMVAALDE